MCVVVVSDLGHQPYPQLVRVELRLGPHKLLCRRRRVRRGWGQRLEHGADLVLGHPALAGDLAGLAEGFGAADLDLGGPARNQLWIRTRFQGCMRVMVSTRTARAGRGQIPDFVQ